MKEDDSMRWILVGMGGIGYHALPRIAAHVMPADHMEVWDHDVVESSNRGRQWGHAGSEKATLGVRALKTMTGLSDITAVPLRAGGEGAPGYSTPWEEVVCGGDARTMRKAQRDTQGCVLLVMPDNQATRYGAAEYVRKHKGGKLLVVCAGNDLRGGECFTSYVNAEGAVVRDWTLLRPREDADPDPEVSCSANPGQSARGNGLTAQCVGWALDDVMPLMRQGEVPREALRDYFWMDANEVAEGFDLRRSVI